ncbi:MAG TPA: glycoside hydrolase family 140 protein [Niabella sp.]|nr:glycoside hydrolase family 140 protein [Niabella sp.]HQW15096.1 glycoside hydrolase family 140 protein [Niabella sp.]HQX20237.1 glycoside hydrolase family 140 protein [Niabella sp.]HRB07358.1 glycoside hydrolase family 140 protein [Niabella sp.]HRB35549.1 glycoside hydrolase family 140 protein [Niabella sp.]
MKRILLYFLFAVVTTTMNAQSLPWLQVSANKHYFQTQNGKPFFWLGDTGWLLFVKCNREEVLNYLDARKQQGFNVVQVMVLHTLVVKNVYGHFALKEGDVSKPLITSGNSFENKTEYDYWDHVDYVIDEAAKRGIYIALVPVWGSAVKSSTITTNQIRKYAEFLANRFKHQSNIIWLNGGDIRGDDHEAIWKTLGATLKEKDPRHLVTYHPRGRYSSTDWFHDAAWLDFNMFQSGHRNYAQDTSSNEKHRFGEDNWRYVQQAWNLNPTKPVLDGEPSYENIPQGLHDSLQPRWTSADLRRYAYWSVFAGAAGFTYGENAIMQFNKMGNDGANYGVFSNWTETLFAPGAKQMIFLKNLMLRYDYFSRKPAQELIVANEQKRYNYILATKGKNYAMAYSYTGRTFKVNTNLLGFDWKKAFWYNPKEGTEKRITVSTKRGIVSFDPPDNPMPGNDWVLVLE